jgi:8-oxo-dGTP pyrophosphatase MutT (NUDIX family)
MDACPAQQMVPPVLARLAHRCEDDPAARGAADGAAGAAAVLGLFGAGDDPDLVLTIRSSLVRQPGQISFPGGAWEPGDTDLVATALREAGEEVGLTPGAAHMLCRLTPVAFTRRPDGAAAAAPVVARTVLPVVAWWDGAGTLAPQDVREVAAVRRWPVSTLVDPGNRVMARHPNGACGPAWIVGDDFCWGFTAGIVDRLLRLGGWERDWDRSHLVEVPERWRRR